MTCRSCGASIVWTVTEKGKKMPVDAEPTLDGNIVLIHKEVGKPPIARYEDKREKATRQDERIDPAARTRFISHFVTCPQAKKWRKKR